MPPVEMEVVGLKKEDWVAVPLDRHVLKGIESTREAQLPLPGLEPAAHEHHETGNESRQGRARLTMARTTMPSPPTTNSSGNQIE